MTEVFLSFIWKYKLYQKQPMFWDQEEIVIISPGEINSDAGPDFTNARIQIGDTLWAGNIEIHLNASDWNRHNHDQNAAYDNVILHVTNQYDLDAYTSKGRKIPTIELKFDPCILDNYNDLNVNNSWISCASKLRKVDNFTILSWLGSLGVDRLRTRTDYLMENLISTVNDWEEIFYRQLARSFGFHVNALSFGLLAGNLPVKILQKHTGNIFQIESLLFGVAGFLNDDYSNDEYFNLLKGEFRFFEKKYSLKTMDLHLWKFLRLRPGNFPTMRIAQFAALMNHVPDTLTKIITAKTINELHSLIIHPLSDYWENHYSFSKISKPAIKWMGIESANIIIINTIVPFLFLYGRQTGKSELEDRAIRFLEEIPAENNAIIKNWIQYGIKPSNSFETQALLHLKSEYCDKKRCIDCRIGIKLISGK